MESLVETSSLYRRYKLGKTEVNALTDINIKIHQGDFLAIAGPSGSGKTTLLNLLGCLDTPSSGEVRISGVQLSNLTKNQQAGIRLKKIGFIFQTFNLIPVLTAYENIEFPLLFGGVDKKYLRKMIETVLEEVGLSDFSTHRPEELSGGQRQRVAIARALVKKPDIIIADEPTANLDSETGKNIIRLMLDLNSKKGSTFIFSTHDKMVIEHASRVIRLVDGKVVH